MSSSSTLHEKQPKMQVYNTANFATILIMTIFVACGAFLYGMINGVEQEADICSAPTIHWITGALKLLSLAVYCRLLLKVSPMSQEDSNPNRIMEDLERILY